MWPPAGSHLRYSEYGQTHPINAGVLISPSELKTRCFKIKFQPGKKINACEKCWHFLAQSPSREVSSPFSVTTSEISVGISLHHH